MTKKKPFAERESLTGQSWVKRGHGGKWLALCALLFALVATPTLADTVTAVIDPLTMETAAGPLRLAGLHVPPKQADGAKALLAELALNRDVRPENLSQDRHGRRLAQVNRGDGLWLQGELLRRGLAVVHTLPETRARAAEMLALEGKARKARQGIWRERPVWRAEKVRGDGFRIVEGKVVDSARRRGAVYLNFGADWRTDFTVAIAVADLPAFAGLDVQGLKGKRVRVRGWVRDYNGPYLEADHAEQIEVLGAKRPRAVNAGSGASR